MTPIYRLLLWRSLMALLLATALVAFCYFAVDRQVATFVATHDIPGRPILKALTYPPPILEDLAPGVLVLLMVRRAWGPFRRGELALLAACVSLLLSVQFKESLKFAFGRTWPGTWIDDNPSYLRDGVYGWHPFHGGSAYSDFPSGHTTRTVALVGVLWIVYPRWRLLGVVATLAVAVGLIGMNYHFVGDVIAGAFLGGIVAAYTTQAVGLLVGDDMFVTSRPGR